METWTGNSLARTEQNRIFAIIICIKYPLSADISQGSDVYKCQVNDTFIIIDPVWPLYWCGSVTIISLRSGWMSEMMKVKGPSSPAGQESHLSMISLIHYLDTSYFQHLSAVYLCHLGILCFPSFPPNRPNNTKFTINLLLILNTENSQV